MAKVVVKCFGVDFTRRSPALGTEWLERFGGERTWAAPCIRPPAVNTIPPQHV